jgi:TolA-binding protein
MKRFASLLLLGALATTYPALAEDQNPQTQNAKRVAAGKANARTVQAGQSFRAQQNVQRNTRLNQGVNSRRYIQPLNMQALANRSRANNAARVYSARNGAISNNAAVGNNVVRDRNWRTRTPLNNPTNSQINAGVAGDQNVQAGDNNGRNRDWQNRSGNWQGNNSNRSGNWQGNNNRWSGNRNWDRQHRNRSWWRSHYSRFSRFGGGDYYWDSGYWYPAYGYDPYFTTYSYDAPIYAYNDEDPGQVIAQVQTELQQRGYDVGGVDGTYGPATRRALLDYQRDSGLPVTGEIDEQTLDSLGLQ